MVGARTEALQKPMLCRISGPRVVDLTDQYQLRYVTSRF